MRYLLLALLLVQDPVTKEDLLRLAREGASEETIIAWAGKARLKLSADDVVQLKKAGVSDRVIARLIEGPTDLKVTNASHKSIRLSVKPGEIDVNLKEGDEVKPGDSLALLASGEYAITIEGGSTVHRVKTPASFTFRGCDIAQLELLTLEIADGSGRRTCLVATRGKVLPSQEPAAIVRYGAPPLEGLWGPRYSWLPFASDTVILGAGVGALVGAYYGNAGQGALIGGGAGLLLDFLNASPY